MQEGGDELKKGWRQKKESYGGNGGGDSGGEFTNNGCKLIISDRRVEVNVM